MKFSSLTLSQISLIIVNCIPLIGVAFFNWSLANIMILFWAENVIIGIYNVFKMVVCLFYGQNRPSFAPLIPFFIVHYGIFTLVHGVFVYSFFVQHNFNSEQSSTFTQAFAYVLDQQLLFPFVAMLISHGISFYMNFIQTEKYLTESADTLMFQPYGRVIILHMTILIGGTVTQALGQPILALVLLIVLKTFVDLFWHKKQNKLDKTVPV